MNGLLRFESVCRALLVNDIRRLVTTSHWNDELPTVSPRLHTGLFSDGLDMDALLQMPASAVTSLQRKSAISTALESTIVSWRYLSRNSRSLRLAFDDYS